MFNSTNDIKPLESAFQFHPEIASNFSKKISNLCNRHSNPIQKQHPTSPQVTVKVGLLGFYHVTILDKPFGSNECTDSTFVACRDDSTRGSTRTSALSGSRCLRVRRGYGIGSTFVAPICLRSLYKAYISIATDSCGETQPTHS